MLTPRRRASSNKPGGALHWHHALSPMRTWHPGVFMFVSENHPAARSALRVGTDKLYQVLRHVPEKKPTTFSAFPIDNRVMRVYCGSVVREDAGVETASHHEVVDERAFQLPRPVNAFDRLPACDRRRR